MRSANSGALLALSAALAGCSSGWWRDAPATAAPPPVTGSPDAGYPAEPPPGATAPDQGYPDQRPSDQGAYYQPPSAGPPPTAHTRRQPAAPALQPGRYPETAPIDAPVRYDNVGYAVWASEAGTIAAAHATLPPGSFAEVTALDTGRTIIVPITSAARSGREIELSGAAAQELGLQGDGQAPVRVRAANPTGADLVALRAGRPAPPRPDTPPVLLNALRHKLSGTLGQVTPDFGPATPPVAEPPRSLPRPAARPAAAPPRPAPIRTPAPARAGPGYYVQIAALADPARAQALARSAGGAVAAGGGLYRVRFGPFGDLRTAQAARDDVARRGYGDARIVRQD